MLPRAAPYRTLSIKIPYGRRAGFVTFGKRPVIFRTRTASFELELLLSNSNCFFRTRTAFLNIPYGRRAGFVTFGKRPPSGGHLSNSNCFFRTRTAFFELELSRDPEYASKGRPLSHAFYQSLTAVEQGLLPWPPSGGHLSNSNCFFRTRTAFLNSNYPRFYKSLTAVEQGLLRLEKGRPLGVIFRTAFLNSNCFF